VEAFQRREKITTIDYGSHDNISIVEVVIPEEAQNLEGKIIRAISSLKGVPRMDIPTYSGNLNPDLLIDWNHWIREMEKFFEFERIEVPKE
jgi:hypothetical protein